MDLLYNPSSPRFHNAIEPISLWSFYLATPASAMVLINMDSINFYSPSIHDARGKPSRPSQRSGRSMIEEVDLTAEAQVKGTITLSSPA